MIRLLSALALAALAAGPVLAQDAPAEAAAVPAPAATGKWKLVLGAATDNRSKDASKSNGEPFAYGLAQWTDPSEFFYAGGGLETIKSSGGSNLEAQAIAGVRPEFGGFDFDLKAAHKWQLDSNPGVDDDAWEFTANMSRSIGPAKGRLQLQYSPDGTGSVREWTWVEARLGWDFTPALEGTVAVGRREQDNAIDYTGWNAGFTYAVNPRLDLDLRYYDTDADVPGQQYAAAVVAGVNAYF